MWPVKVAGSAVELHPEEAGWLAAWAGLEPARTCFKDRRATDYSTTHRSLEAASNRRPSRYEGDALAKLSYPGMIDSEPRARFELAPARYNVAALPPELSRMDWEKGRDPVPPAWKVSTLPIRHSQLLEVRAARLERARAECDSTALF